MTNILFFFAAGPSSSSSLAPTASMTLKKLKDEQKVLLERREELRTELDQLLESAGTPTPAPSAISAVPPHRSSITLLWTGLCAFKHLYVLK